MDSFIKKIFNQNVDELCHSQFTKFSRGEFPNRAMVRIKNSKGKFSISTTAEYAKELVMSLAGKVGEEEVSVSGALISALDLEGFDYKEKKSAIGVRKYIIESEMSGNEILELCNKVDKAFFGLSFSFKDNVLKIKPKSPKSAKGAGSKPKEGEKIKIDFCKLKTQDKSIVDGLLLNEEPKNFKNIEIIHEFVIEKIVMPSEEELNEKGIGKNDFAKIREMAKRQGKIIRKVVIDGNESTKEKEFVC